MKIGFVCTNYKNSSFTEEAIKTFFAACGGPGHAVVVVDNDSGLQETQNLRRIAEGNANVNLVLSSENLGYFPGLNKGISYLRRHRPDLDCMVIGNNDLVFPADFAVRLAGMAQTLARYAVVSPDIVTIDGVRQNPHVIDRISKLRECIYDLYHSNYHLAVAIKKIARLTHRFSRRGDEMQWRHAQPIHQGHGSCYILTPLFFRHFEQLWAPTFLLGEEFFLSRQLAEAGLRIYYDPGVSVIHHYHAAIQRVPARRMWELSRISHRLYRRYVAVFGRPEFPLPPKAESHRSSGSSAAPGYRVCVNCVMDTSDAKITFDAHGYCDHCRTFYRQTKPNWATGSAGEVLLQALVRQVKEAGRGKDFDCILGMSGGIDSSYLTYIAKEQLGLRPLVFHVDAGWNSQIAVNNIERVVDGLGLDLYTEVIDWGEMRDLQIAFFKAGVPHLDTPQDHAFFATMYKFAEQHDIKFIFTGANLSTECVRNPVEWMYYQSDSVQLRDIHRRFGRVPLRTFPITSILRHKIYLPYFKGIRAVRPLNYIDYKKEAAMELLTRRFGWQPYPQKHFESRFTRFYESYWLPAKFGFDTRRVQFSSLILTGQMTRAEALEKLQKPAYDPATIDQDFEFVAAKLDITTEELRGYLKIPNRTYRDYKSQAWMFDLGARAMKLLGLEVGGKR